MRIVDLIRREMIVPALSATSKPKIIEELAKHLASNVPELENKVLSRILLDREGLASTAIGEGVAIPHGKSSSVEQIVACLGRARRGVDFDSMDGKPTFLFFVLIAPENSTGAHLKALARISRVFKDGEFRKRLLDADDADSMFAIIADEDGKY
ncbi:MAG: PTS sugar transporter subunit IIA [Deltaproteobacteria bacterium]|nr:PTS sugar transporter subunit IIA [Deltaproteobacteria bacterium]